MDEQAQRLRRTIDALEEEKLKIQVFQSHFPLCLDLVNKAIEDYRQQLSSTTTIDFLHGGRSGCSEQISTRGLVVEEFIPIKRPCSFPSGCSGRQSSEVDGTQSSNDNKTKSSDWRRSARLWNQTTPDPSPEDDAPLKREPTQPNKKQKHYWSPELHHRFLLALQQLGSYHATPTQIRELMKVDDLTYEEVKSHLQIYRLENRRPSHSSMIPPAGTQAPEFKVAGGIWATQAPAITAPVQSATTQPPAPSNHKKIPDDSEGTASHNTDGEEETRGTRLNLRTTSTSSHTTTGRFYQWRE